MLARSAESGLVEITMCLGNGGSRTVLFDPDSGEYVDAGERFDHAGHDSVDAQQAFTEDSSPCPFALTGEPVQPISKPFCTPGDVHELPCEKQASPALTATASAPLPPRGPPAHS